MTRKLDDGREFRIVKVFREPMTLADRLRGLGFEADIGAHRALLRLRQRALLQRVIDVPLLRHLAFVHRALRLDFGGQLVPPDRRGLRWLVSSSGFFASSSRMKRVCSDT